MAALRSGQSASRLVTAAAHAIVEADDAESRFTALCSILGEIGIDQINYGFFDPAAARRDEAEVVFLSTMRSDWMSYYYAQTLHLTDPHVVKVRQGNLLPYWWDDRAMAALGDPAVRRTALEIEEAGIRSAICTPLASPFAPDVPVAGMTLGSSRRGADLAGELGSEAARLVSVVHLFHQLSLGELRRRKSGATPLTARERDCLLHAADGLQQEAIAHRLGLARITVEIHLRNVRRKLKARTLPEAVAKAIAYGEIQIE